MTLDEMELLLASADNNNELVLLGQQVGPQTLMEVLEFLGGPRGCLTYIPSPDNFFRSLKQQQRDHDICLRYNGTNTADLAQEYGIKPRRVQQIIKSQKVAREID